MPTLRGPKPHQVQNLHIFRSVEIHSFTLSVSCAKFMHNSRWIRVIIARPGVCSNGAGNVGGGGGGGGGGIPSERYLFDTVLFMRANATTKDY